MMSALLSRCLILVLGTLYPAYRSYKAIKNKDLREHVKWMMYWIVFALFTTAETFLDIFFSWFPFYYEIKILFILWVLSPATRGSSLLYKKLVHPLLISREKEIDDLIEKTKQQGYSTFIQLFSSGFNYASNLFLTSALKGQMLLGNQLKKSLSLNDVFGEISNSNSSNQRQQTRNNGGNTMIEEEYSDDYDEHVSRPTNNRQQIKQTNKKIISNKNSYDLIDDDILSLTDDSTDLTTITSRKPPTAPSNSAASTTTTTKKRSNSKQPKNQDLQQQQHNSTAQISSYKSNEASHFGTITRGKTSKNKATSSGVNYDNE